MLWNFTPCKQKFWSIFIACIAAHQSCHEAVAEKNEMTRYDMSMDLFRGFVFALFCCRTLTSFGKARFLNSTKFCPPSSTNASEVKDWLQDGRCPPIEASGTFTRFAKACILCKKFCEADMKRNVMDLPQRVALMKVSALAWQ